MVMGSNQGMHELTKKLNIKNTWHQYIAICFGSAKCMNVNFREYSLAQYWAIIRGSTEYFKEREKEKRYIRTTIHCEKGYTNTLN